MTLSAGTRVGPYQIVSPLGAGGMGEVYRARDTRLRREVALKVLPAEVSGSSDRLRRFESEARAASALNHPNIVVVYDVGVSDSISYIAMERVEGKNLREVMATAPLPARQILALATQIAEGLARAHASGIVHRDLKPENVMVTEDGLVKVLDFGLAKLSLPSAENVTSGATASVEIARTDSGVVLGTIGYMSPEQAAGREVDYRSDQFSLGSILYEMATGRRPFEGDSAVQTLTAIIEKDPAPVGALKPDVPAPLVWVIERCLAKTASGRYESTRDLARDLANLRDRLSAGGSSSHAAPGLDPAAPSRSRAPLFAAVAALAGAAIAAGVIGALGLLHKPQPAPPSFRQLTFRPGTITSARFAPDGEAIVYAAAWEGRPPELFLVRRGSTESRPLGVPAAKILSISRSGEMAVLLGQEAAVIGSGTLARVPLSGGAPRELLGGVLDADWTSDDSLVATTREKDRSRVWFPLGRMIHESAETIYALRVSPKGDRVACLEGGFRAVGDVVLIDRAGAKSTLSRGWVALYGLAWSPDGEEVRFTGSRGDGQPALYGVSMTGKERVILRAPLWILLADAFRDGSALMISNVQRGGLACLTPGQTSERQLGWLDSSSLESLSSDGKTLLFTEQRLGGGPYGSVYVRGTDGSAAIRLADGSGEGLSPDGKWALIKKDYEKWTLMPTGAGSPRTLPRGNVTKLFEGDWLDAKRIVFSGYIGDRPLRVFLQDVDGGDPRPLTSEGVSIPQNAAVTPDGKFVLAVSDKGWFLYPVDGSSPRLVRGLTFGEGPVGWSASGATVYVRQERDGPTAEIEALDIATGRRRPWKTLALTDPSGVVKIFPIIVAPDEKSYCYSYDRLLSTMHLVEGIR